jgi:hypothetical protein
LREAGFKEREEYVIRVNTLIINIIPISYQFNKRQEQRQREGLEKGGRWSNKMLTKMEKEDQRVWKTIESSYRKVRREVLKRHYPELYQKYYVQKN